MSVNFNPAIQTIRRRMLGEEIVAQVSEAIDNAANEGKRTTQIEGLTRQQSSLLYDYLSYEGWTLYSIVEGPTYTLRIDW